MSVHKKFEEWWNTERLSSTFSSFKHVAEEAYKAGYTEQAQFDKYMRKRFGDVIPDLCSGSWEEIWERVRDKFQEIN